MLKRTLRPDHAFSHLRHDWAAAQVTEDVLIAEPLIQQNDSQDANDDREYLRNAHNVICVANQISQYIVSAKRVPQECDLVDQGGAVAPVEEDDCEGTTNGPAGENLVEVVPATGQNSSLRCQLSRC